ncbi:MAG: outer membrane beta-barrel protein [Paludibacteraceae bacterium]|nr:outer membrane beta-barrel protein [Paludibacteraceae bacterium]
MQKNTDNNSHDAFSELFRQKLENHTLPVDDGAWNAIQKSIAARKRKRLIPLWWLSAAAVMVLSFLIFSNPNNELSKQVAENKTIENTTEKTISVKQKTDIMPQNLTKHNIAEQQIVQKNTHNSTSSNQSETKPVSDNQHANYIRTNISNDFAETAKNTDPKTIVADSVQQETVSNDGSETILAENDKKKDLSKEEKKNIIELAQSESDWEDPLKTEISNEWVVLASLGSGRSSSGSPQFLDASNSDLYTGLVRAPSVKTTATILEPADFSSRKFHAPISFGLRAGKQINKQISVETGLVYTYLLTDLESASYNATLNLHYLGIPVNAKASIWTNRQWSVYASGGAMIEKGLRSVYIQEQQLGNQTIKTTASTNIEGFQWSVNAALGVAYNFAGAFDFYFEPGFSYFFDNDQPLSIRSDRQFTLGVEAGLRYAF